MFRASGSEFAPDPLIKISTVARNVLGLHAKDDPRGAARKLALPLAQAMTRETYDPFSG